jgi:exopolysaccharide production protein ExoF
MSYSLGFGLMLCLSQASAAADAAYRLGPQDKIRVKVTEWRPNTGDVYEWSALSGDFIISATGTASIPIIGSVQAGGLTTSELGQRLSEQLKKVAGLVSSPSAAIDIIQYRPFYVDGIVERPGEYAFRPGMSVIQAISIAGGIYRPESTLARMQRETIIAQGDIRFNETQRFALLLRRDRLLSEARDAEKVTFSDEVLKYPDTQVARQGMDEEQALFASRRTTIRTQLDQFEQSKSLLQDELKTLASKSVTQQRQYDLVRKELDNINSLIDKKLAVQPRQLSVEQNLAQIESQNLDLILATQRAKQEISRIDRLKTEQLNQRQTEISKELRETQVTLRQATDRIRSLQLLTQEFALGGLQDDSEQSGDTSRLRFTILRPGPDGLESMPAEQNDAVQAGDIVKVERRPLRALGAAPQTSQHTADRQRLSLVP